MKSSFKITIVVIVVVILVASGVGIYLNNQSQQTNNQTTKNSLTVDEQGYPDSFDPAETATTAGWEIDEQVYQGLVTFNGTSDTTFVGVLAQNWTVSSNHMNYTFHLRNNVVFSNGDPFNAYVMWYSIYRTLVMEGPLYFILWQNMYNAGPDFNVTASVLNSINYTSPSSAALTTMENPNQSVQVVNSSEVIIHLGYGYNGNLPFNAFLETLTTPLADAVDPIVIHAHGGVVAGSPNSWMQTNATGTSFYKISSATQGESITLIQNPNYWANSVPKSQLNTAIQPAYLKYIVLNYKSLVSEVSDIKSGLAQMAEIPIQEYSSLAGTPNVNISILPVVFGSTESANMLYMDPLAYQPFQNIDVRKAITYAIDYNGIINSVLQGHGTQWITPIVPGYPDYNQSIQGLKFYQYNATLAAHYLADAGYQAILPNGTILNPNAPKLGPVNFLYCTDYASQTSVAQIIQKDLASIGITITLSPLTYASYIGTIWTPGTNDTQYPMGISMYSADYVSPDDPVTLLVVSYIGTSDYFNATVYNWAVNATTSFDQQSIIQNFTYITHTLYGQYSLIGLYVSYVMTVRASNIAGIIQNPEGSGACFFFFYNTVHYTS